MPFRAILCETRHRTEARGLKPGLGAPYADLHMAGQPSLSGRVTASGADHDFTHEPSHRPPRPTFSHAGLLFFLNHFREMPGRVQKSQKLLTNRKDYGILLSSERLANNAAQEYDRQISLECSRHCPYRRYAFF